MSLFSLYISKTIKAFLILLKFLIPMSIASFTIAYFTCLNQLSKSLTYSEKMYSRNHSEYVLLNAIESKKHIFDMTDGSKKEGLLITVSIDTKHNVYPSGLGTFQTHELIELHKNKPELFEDENINYAISLSIYSNEVINEFKNKQTFRLYNGSFPVQRYNWLMSSSVLCLNDNENKKCYSFHAPLENISFNTKGEIVKNINFNEF
jgi:hypothetical protein